jgi:deoxynucleoside triphosphate triphosphohydrolase SAMHD1
MSKQMLEYLIDDNSIDMDRADIRFIQELIEGNPSKANEDRRWMYEIVANNRNSVDVDKFDYLARDCYNLGIKSSYDFSRLMKFSRVVNNEVCFHSKEVYNMYEMFHTRYSLWKQVYSHRVGKAIEYMVSDALLYADPYLKISERISSPETYCYLTDSILTQIEGSTEPQLAQSRAIIKRMRKRDLYKMADEIIVPSHKQGTFPAVTVEGILEYKPADADLKAEDIIVDIFTCNYGAFGAFEWPSSALTQISLLPAAKKDQNPVDHVHFFSKWDQKESYLIPKEKVSLLIPEVFSEKYVRIYCRDASKVEAAQAAFRTFLKTRDSTLASPQYTVPLKRSGGVGPDSPAKRRLEFVDLPSE